MEGSTVGVNAEPAAYGGAGGDDGTAINDDEDEHSSRPRPFGSNGEKNKRRRTVSLDAASGQSNPANLSQMAQYSTICCP